MGCKMSKRARKHKQEEVAIEERAPEIDDFSTLKRAKLQKLCKQNKLKANGKNTELISRLQDHFKEIRQQTLMSNNNNSNSSSFPSEDAGTSQSNESTQVHRAENASEEEKVVNRWCVAEGIAKTGDEIHWLEIILSGGRPMVLNRFGKLIPFLLEPSMTAVPRNVTDNLICGICARKNEEMRSKDCTRARNQPLRKQGNISGNTKENISDFTRNHLSGSVKRKRLEPDSAALKRQRKEPTAFRPLTGPAKPEVQRTRGEKISLAKKIKHPWRSSRESTPSREDPEFARRVEAIINSTVPGSKEERDLVMRATASPVQHSPTKA